MAPVFSTLRDHENYHKVVVFVLNSERPESTARCVKVFIVATRLLYANGKTDPKKDIFSGLPEELLDHYFPRRTDGDLGPFNHNAQTIGFQASLPYELVKAIVHYKCTYTDICLFAGARCAQVGSHIVNVHLAKQKTGMDSLRQHIETILPWFVCEDGSDWIEHLTTHGRYVASLLGKRDIIPIADALEAAMQAIIDGENPLAPAPSVLPPVVQTAPAAIHPPAPPPAPVAPVSGSSTRQGKRKAQDDAAPEDLKRARYGGAANDDGAGAASSSSLPGAAYAAFDVTSTSPFATMSGQDNAPTGAFMLSGSYDVAEGSSAVFINEQHAHSSYDSENSIAAPSQSVTNPVQIPDFETEFGMTVDEFIKRPIPKDLTPETLRDIADYLSSVNWTGTPQSHGLSNDIDAQVEAGVAALA